MFLVGDPELNIQKNLHLPLYEKSHLRTFKLPRCWWKNHLRGNDLVGLVVFQGEHKMGGPLVVANGIVHVSGQIIATSHDLTPNGGLVREIPLFQENPGW